MFFINAFAALCALGIVAAAPTVSPIDSANNHVHSTRGSLVRRAGDSASSTSPDISIGSSSVSLQGTGGPPGGNVTSGRGPTDCPPAPAGSTTIDFQHEYYAIGIFLKGWWLPSRKWICVEGYDDQEPHDRWFGRSTTRFQYPDDIKVTIAKPELQTNLNVYLSPNPPEDESMWIKTQGTSHGIRYMRGIEVEARPVAAINPSSVTPANVQATLATF